MFARLAEQLDQVRAPGVADDDGDVVDGALNKLALHACRAEIACGVCLISRGEPFQGRAEVWPDLMPEIRFDAPDILLCCWRPTSGHVIDALDALLTARSLTRTLDMIADRFRGVRGMVGSLEEAMSEQVPLGEVFELASHFGGTIEDFISTMEGAIQATQ